MRAMQPDAEGYVERDGVKVGYEVFGNGDPTILLMPTWAIVNSRRWKDQVPYLARHFRVITYDARGSGRSDRPADPAAYASREIGEDAVAVLDETCTDAAVAVGMSRGGGYLLELAANHPERVLGAVCVGAALGLGDPPADRPSYSFDEPLDSGEGWARYNRHFWLRDWPGFVEFFMGQVITEPHSTKFVEDSILWGLETTPETIVTLEDAPYLPDGARNLIERVRCPSLVVHGSDDHIIGLSGGERLAAALGCDLEVFEGSGHAVDAREPVRFNLLLRDFVDRLRPPAPAVRSWTRARSRRPGRSTCRRRSALDTRCGTWPSPASCGRCGLSSK
ncbi:MAG: alpha/beta hydrolase [Propionibacteriaceae bacterium]|nr:alpha/beta hydrolase [Propionibacteriaceae bacterium]